MPRRMSKEDFALLVNQAASLGDEEWAAVTACRLRLREARKRAPKKAGKPHVPKNIKAVAGE